MGDTERWVRRVVRARNAIAHPRAFSDGLTLTAITMTVEYLIEIHLLFAGRRQSLVTRHQVAGNTPNEAGTARQSICGASSRRTTGDNGSWSEQRQISQPGHDPEVQCHEHRPRPRPRDGRRVAKAVVRLPDRELLDQPSPVILGPMSPRHPGWKALAEAVAPGARVTRLRRLAGAGMTDAYDVTLDRAPRRVVVKLYPDGDGTAPLGGVVSSLPSGSRTGA